MSLAGNAAGATELYTITTKVKLFIVISYRGQTHQHTLTQTNTNETLFFRFPSL